MTPDIITGVKGSFAARLTAPGTTQIHVQSATVSRHYTSHGWIFLQFLKLKLSFTVRNWKSSTRKKQFVKQEKIIASKCILFHCHIRRRIWLNRHKSFNQNKINEKNKQNHFSNRTQMKSFYCILPFGCFAIYIIYSFQSSPVGTLGLHQMATRLERWLCMEPQLSSPATQGILWWALGYESVCPMGFGVDHRSNV